MDDKDYNNGEDSIDIDLDVYGYGATGSDYLDYLDTHISSIDIDSINLDYDMSSVYTIAGGGTGGAGQVFTSTGAGAQWASTNVSSTATFGDSDVTINTDGIRIKEGGDLMIGDRSLSEFMKTIEDRLAILVPDPAKLEKFEALKKAYEHYKLMEKLCQENTEESK